MKKYIIALSAIVLIQVNVVAEIKNGYALNINNAKIALENLSKINIENPSMNTKSGETLTYYQIQKLNFKIDSLKKFILNYELTEKILNQFRIIVP